MLIRTANPGPYRGASLDYSGDILPVSGTQEFPDETYESYHVPADFGNQPVRRQLHSVMMR